MAECKKELQATVQLVTPAPAAFEKAASTLPVTDSPSVSRRRPPRYIPGHASVDFWLIGQSEKPVKHRFGHD